MCFTCALKIYIIYREKSRHEFKKRKQIKSAKKQKWKEKKSKREAKKTKYNEERKKN